jgi:hypothetical protein
VVLDRVIHSQEHQVNLLQMVGVMMVVLELQDQVVQVVLVVAVVLVLQELLEIVHQAVMVELDIDCQQHIEIQFPHQGQVVVVV